MNLEWHFQLSWLQSCFPFSLFCFRVCGISQGWTWGVSLIFLIVIDWFRVGFHIIVLIALVQLSNWWFESLFSLLHRFYLTNTIFAVLIQFVKIKQVSSVYLFLHLYFELDFQLISFAEVNCWLSFSILDFNTPHLVFSFSKVDFLLRVNQVEELTNQLVRPTM